MACMLCNTIKDITPYINADTHYCEYKYDGGRCIYDKGSFRGRENKKSHSTNYTKKIPELESHLSCILDGELVYENPNMERYDRYLVLMRRLRITSSFAIRIQSKISPVVFVVFDILEINGKDLRNLPLIERKEILKHFKFDNPNFRKIEFSTEIERTLFTAQEKGFEGIILKEINSTYENKRSSKWLKYKFNTEKVINFNQFTYNDAGIRLTNGFDTIQIPKNIQQEIISEINKKGNVNCEVEYLDKSKKGHIRFGVFKRIKNV